MKEIDINLFSVESLMEEVQFSPSPAFRDSLYNQLKQELSSTNISQILHTLKRVNQFDNGRSKPVWRWIFTAAVVVCLALFMLVMSVPGVKAQMISLVQHFGIMLPLVKEGLVISPFTPLAPQQIPTQMVHFISYSQQADGPIYLELRYFSQDTFLVIYQAPVQAEDVLPQGEPIRIGGNDAIVNRDLSGVIFLAAQRPQPWRQAGSGGGGGHIDEDVDAPPEQLFYTSANQITWIQSGLYIEFLTNLSFDEAVRLAETMRPASQLKNP